MKLQKSQTGNAIIWVVVLVVGLGIGFAVGRVSHKSTTVSSSDSMMSHSSTPAVSSNTDGVTVGGAKMVASKNIVANALDASNVTTVVKLVEDAGLVSTLESAGPFTVFAPNNGAFAKLTASTVAALQQPANVATLKNILVYHVVPGVYTSAALRVMATKGQSMTTVQGEQLTPVLENNQLELKDAKGNLVTIQTSDVISSNGVTFVINSVLQP
jgi:uncharacterized surface protein with fasciclin (FAS1) repeats